MQSKKKKKNPWLTVLYFVDFKGKRVVLLCKKKRHQHHHP